MAKQISRIPKEVLELGKTTAKGKKPKSFGNKKNVRGLEKKLTPQQEEFCRLYTSKEFYGNGTWSYAEAFDLDISDPKVYRRCMQGATTLLTNEEILVRLNELIDDRGLNDAFVDKQLLFVITQNADLHAKMKAITVYNDLKNRITRKLELHINPIEKLSDDDLEKEIRELETLDVEVEVIEPKQISPPNE